jgi:hypothetical protein
MNTLTDDTGCVVAAVGSEGSIARLQCQYPLLIANLKYNSEHGAWGDAAIIKELTDKGFKGIELENMKDLCLT